MKCSGRESDARILWIVIALVFIGLPFTVRTVQPILESLGQDQEQAAASLGASRFTTLRRVVLPEVLPALLTGFSLAFARGLGEYGSVIFIAGNRPYRTEVAPLLITIRLEEYDYDGAIAAYESLLETPDLTPAMQESSMLSLAQLYAQQERYAETVRVLSDRERTLLVQVTRPEKPKRWRRNKKAQEAAASGATKKGAERE